MRKRILTILATALLTLGLLAGPAAADPTPPTEGGNGAGHSGQCTGDPDDRPAVCPAT
jgi:hypothetical protein